LKRGEYKSAMRQLLKVTYEDSFYASTWYDILLIKCYYELNDEMPLAELLCQLGSSLSIEVRSSPNSVVENNLHFIKHVKMLAKTSTRKGSILF
jgi:hypothetical protein